MVFSEGGGKRNHASPTGGQGTGHSLSPLNVDPAKSRKGINCCAKVGW